MAAVVKNLIFDLGFHSGEDTDFDLKKGFSVVGIEANPHLVANAAVRFQDAITQGRLHLISGAIAPASAGEKVAFYANPNNSGWGTIRPDWSRETKCLDIRANASRYLAWTSPRYIGRTVFHST